MNSHFQEHPVTFKNKTSLTQAYEILDKMLELGEAGYEKIGLTYSANRQQSAKIYKTYGSEWKSGFTGTRGGNQAEVIQTIENILYNENYTEQASNIVSVYLQSEGQKYKDAYVYNQTMKKLFYYDDNGKSREISNPNPELIQSLLTQPKQNQYLSLSLTQCRNLLPSEINEIIAHTKAKSERYRNALNRKFFILPISTCEYLGGRGEVDNSWLVGELTSIFNFCKNKTSMVLGWTNENRSNDEPFAIGGGTSKLLEDEQKKAIQTSLKLLRDDQGNSDKSAFHEKLHILREEIFNFKLLPQQTSYAECKHEDLHFKLDKCIARLEANNLNKRDTAEGWLFKLGFKNKKLADRRSNLTNELLHELRVIKAALPGMLKGNNDAYAMAELQINNLLDQAIKLNSHLSEKFNKSRDSGSLHQILTEEKDKLLEPYKYNYKNY